MSIELNERRIDIECALMTNDSEALYRLAQLEAKEGNDEYAHALLAEARRIDREDWAYDEAVDNALTE